MDRRKMRCSSSHRVSAGLILSFLTLLPIGSAVEQVPLQPIQSPTDLTVASNKHVFTLRHIVHHGLYKHPNLHKRLDINPDDTFVTAYEDEIPKDTPPPRLAARSNPIQIERLADRRHDRIAEYLAYSSFTGTPRILDPEYWSLDLLPAPNVTDKETVINLAIMAANAYVPKVGQGQWEDVGQGYNTSTPIGWESDGLRGHIFADEGNKTVIVALKGTSPAVFDGDGTTTNDKINDNLFFSCCCGQGGRWLWKQACDCASSESTYTCNNTCLVKALKKKTRYYGAALELYNNITELYPNSNTWIVGHSLGGAVSAMVGLTYGLPVVTFEAPGDDLAARRLGLPIPSFADPRHPYQGRYTGAYHFGHTADPIFMGSCTGLTSLCTLGGYAMESQCHTGMQCTYDTVGDLGWRVSAMYHRIHDVIDNVLTKYDKVPVCEHDLECVDCYKWKYFESNGSTTTTSAIPTTTAPPITRTEICKTPGWWRCLDGSSSSPVMTTTYTTTSCADPGWFGCNSEVNVTITTTTALPIETITTTHITTTYTTTTCVVSGSDGCDKKSTKTVTSTSISTICKTPGVFWGCWDETTTKKKTSSTITSSVTSTSMTSSTSATTATTSSSGGTTSPPSTTCRNPGIFWGCWDPTTTSRSSTATPAHSITLPPPTVTATSSAPASTSTSTKPGKGGKKCRHTFFFGWLCLDRN